MEPIYQFLRIQIPEFGWGTAKQDVEQIVNRLPDYCTVEDVHYHLYVFEKITLGLQRV